MERKIDCEKYNGDILLKMSKYLNFAERAITKEQVEKVSACGVSQETAVLLLLSSYIDADEILEREYLPYILKKLDTKDYLTDSYYRNIKFSTLSNGNWQLKTDMYAPYEIFVRDDFEFRGDMLLPQLGYFDGEFRYPAVYQDGVLWMSVTPNEINTMSAPIARANGKVLTFGLGLGYFAYMCLQKDSVEHITVIERDNKVIELFREAILPQFSRKDCISIIQADAYDYLNSMKDGEFDYVFVDIYHDASDGREVYLKFKEYEKRFVRTQFDYWIEKTIKYYI